MWDHSPHDPIYVDLYRQFTARFLNLTESLNWLPKPKPFLEPTQEALPQRASHHCQAQPCTDNHLHQQQAPSADNNKWPSDNNNDNEQPYFQTVQPLQAPPAPNIGDKEWSFNDNNDEQLLLQTEQPLQPSPVDLIACSPALANTAQPTDSPPLLPMPS